MYMNPRFAWARFNRPLFTATVVAVAALLAGAATRAGAQSGPISIWPATAVPANPTVTDKKPIELGVKFRSDVNGFITALRFYKGPSNTGTHTGTLDQLWHAAGARDLHQQDGLGVAAHDASHPRGAHGKHDLRVVVLRA